MQFKLVAVVLSLLASVNAAPTVELTAPPLTPLTQEELDRFNARVETPGPIGSIVAASDIEKRATTHLYACQNPNFLGPCQNFAVTTGICYDWTGFWNDNVGSLGPDPGVTCCAYLNWGCSGSSFCFQNPGYADIGSWNDKLSSYNCYLNN